MLTCQVATRPRSHHMAGPQQQAPRQSRLAIHNRQRPRQAEETVPSVRVTRATSVRSASRRLSSVPRRLMTRWSATGKGKSPQSGCVGGRSGSVIFGNGNFRKDRGGPEFCSSDEKRVLRNATNRAALSAVSRPISESTSPAAQPGCLRWDGADGRARYRQTRLPLRRPCRSATPKPTGNSQPPTPSSIVSSSDARPHQASVLL
jgi:hypothetical protein